MTSAYKSDNPGSTAPGFQDLRRLIFTDDFRQRRRITIVLMTVFVYLICAALLLYGARHGLFSARANVLALGCLVTPWVFYAMMRSGWNLRCAEPSLALPQALWGQTLVVAVYSVIGPAHPAALVFMVTNLVFGMFELDTTSVWKLLAYSLCSIGIVMAWCSHTDPAVYRPDLQVMYFIVAAVVMPSISSLSIQLRRMRQRLRRQKAELEEALKQIRRVATHDELTGLPNRRQMLALLLEHAMRQGRGGPGFMVALADLDHFKAVNDTFGHRIGDDALVCFAQQARTHLRTTDIIGRWGGEEFLIILPESPAGDPHVGIERLRSALAGIEVSTTCPTLRIAFSAGISRFQPGERIDDVIERADKALYAAKAEGRNRTCCDPATQ